MGKPLGGVGPLGSAQTPEHPAWSETTKQQRAGSFGITQEEARQQQCLIEHLASTNSILRIQRQKHFPGTGEGNTEGSPGACEASAGEVREGFLEEVAPERSHEGQILPGQAGQGLISLTPPSPRANTQ